jgi:hypothetical protein
LASTRLVEEACPKTSYLKILRLSFSYFIRMKKISKSLNTEKFIIEYGT